MNNNKILILVVSILACEMAGFIGSIFTTPALSGWYASLNKPALTPPGWVFGVVWIALFFLIGMSLYLIWTSDNKDKKLMRNAVGIFIWQMVLNIWWSVIFFGIQSPFYALIEIAFLWAAILLNIIYFYRISFRAGLLLLPYIFWVSFAAVLNFIFWRLNL
ncbi:MAG: tryptophan-rich sensory protein [Candidatus Nealsonbacteria bacterium]|nr:tryptophan-rich sensory protein [Candidatus Nealsonbacteria bacterium]